MKPQQSSSLGKFHHAGAAKIIFLGALSIGASASWAEALYATAFDSSGGLMPDVVVYATPVGAPVPPAGKLPTLTISQQDMQFSPYVTTVRTGTQIRFPNLDKMSHHVKSFSPAKEFEFPVYQKDTPPPVLFDKPGVVVAYCLFHGWMRAYVMVVDTPYFAKSDPSGTVKLDGLPLGEYEVKAWHPDMGTIKPAIAQMVKVTDKGMAPLNFRFDFVPRKRKAAKV